MFIWDVMALLHFPPTRRFQEGKVRTVDSLCRLMCVCVLWPRSCLRCWIMTEIADTRSCQQHQSQGGGNTMVSMATTTSAPPPYTSSINLGAKPFTHGVDERPFGVALFVFCEVTNYSLIVFSVFDQTHAGWFTSITAADPMCLSLKQSSQISPARGALTFNK